MAFIGFTIPTKPRCQVVNECFNVFTYPCQVASIVQRPCEVSVESLGFARQASIRMNGQDYKLKSKGLQSFQGLVGLYTTESLFSGSFASVWERAAYCSARQPFTHQLSSLATPFQVFALESFCRSKGDYVTAVLTGIYPITIRCRVCDLILIGEGYCYTACLMMIFSAWGIPHGGLSLNASGFHHSVKPWFESRSAISCLNPRPLWFVQSYVKYQFGSMPRFHVYLFKGSRPSVGTEMFSNEFKTFTRLLFLILSRMFNMNSQVFVCIYEGRESSSALWTFG